MHTPSLAYLQPLRPSRWLDSKWVFQPSFPTLLGGSPIPCKFSNLTPLRELDWPDKGSMCGILGVIAKRGQRPSPDDQDLVSMRDTMTRRGPDGAGLLKIENMALAHRRLAIIDASSAGRQPMSTPDGRYHLVYNGELYNDAELRAELLAMDAVPGGFRGQSDTETVLFAFAAWGPDAFVKFRGMFALGVYDTHEHRLHLVRDPLGLKPLYYHISPGGPGQPPTGELTFASEPAAVLRHPYIEPLPDLPMVSAYLTTLRSVLGSRTLFHGVHSMEPGEYACFDTESGNLQRFQITTAAAVGDPMPFEEAQERVRAGLKDSVRRHLRSDVPLCSLLSGGLDSTVLCRIERDLGTDLRTWCSGGPEQGGEESDFHFARNVARELNTEHNEVHISRADFTRDWAWMVQEQGLPLSTPNEVAIYNIARDLRKSNQVVAISGEGADELFGGYGPALQAASDFSLASADRRCGGQFQLESVAWVATSIKPHILSHDAWEAAQGDAFLLEHYESTFERAKLEAGPESHRIDPFLRFQRHNNLTGLVQRLDTATMLASVEGRTPFADWEMTRLAESLTMDTKFTASAPGAGGGTAVATAMLGKRVLREAWRGRIPNEVIARNKHSFPLPFDQWIEDLGWRLESSPFARIAFKPEILDAVMRDPNSNWQFAWPLMNMAMWGDRWWG
ncbi:MAG: asparagine synthase (glutamine-hydrolyzing) [Candidatus Paceibacteria bacterium]|jgi:asparagine synthase (glutamine-hydrolysing)